MEDKKENAKGIYVIVCILFVILISGFFRLNITKEREPMEGLQSEPGEYEYNQASEQVGDNANNESAQSESQQVGSLAECFEVTVGNYIFSLPKYWHTEISEDDKYLASNEHTGNLATLQIDAIHDSNSPVTFERLIDEINNGILLSPFTTGYEFYSISPAQYVENDCMKGYSFQLSCSKDEKVGYKLCFCFPDEANNDWYYVVFTEEDSMEVSYSIDYQKMLNSIRISNSPKAVTQENHNQVLAFGDGPDYSPKEMEAEVDTFTGASLTEVENLAKKMGLVNVMDSDYYHGARCEEFAYEQGTSSVINVIYRVDTKEIISASFLPKPTMNEDEQKELIMLMAPLLCPSEDADAVVEWVNQNIGSDAKTKIGGFTYQLILGSDNTLLYFAGYDEWEAWEGQFY